MNSISSLAGGYKQKSRRSLAPKPTPVKRNHVLEMLSSFKNYYIENDLTDDDILFIIENIKCLKNNTIYRGDLKSSILTERIYSFIKANYRDENLTLNNLDDLVNSLNEILLNTTQNEKVVEVKKVVKIKNTLDPQTLSNGYKGGFPRIESEGNLPKTEIKPIVIDFSLQGTLVRL